LLFTRYNGNPEFVGACARVPASIGQMTYPDKLIRVRVDERICDSRFVMFAFAAPAVRDQIRSLSRTTAGQIGISGRSLRQVRIPLPPLSEQRRIVAALEDHLSHLEVGVATLQSTDLRLRRWLAGFLASSTGVSGDERSLPGDWQILRIEDMAQVGSGATPLRYRRDYYEDGTVPWITSSLLNSPFINKSEKYITEKAVAETAVKLWPVGTLLVAMYGEGKTRGHCSELRISATTNQACAAIVVLEEFKDLQPWIKLVLESSYEKTRNLASGGVQPNLSVGLIRDLHIPLPPHIEQERILANVEQIRYASEILQRELKNAERKAQALRRSLLRCAFLGQLVSQNLVDEPASVLLELIRTRRATRLQAQQVAQTAKHAPQEETLL
jgi:type I restriction enzyme, S subunit